MKIRFLLKMIKLVKFAMKKSNKNVNLIVGMLSVKTVSKKLLDFIYKELN